jgi:2-polyprenyl-6-methoxyphenol hydroxylase-like FAD-dependent oxidoreductase
MNQQESCQFAQISDWLDTITKGISMVSATCRVGIIGAGTSGIYLARLLLDQGFQVSVFEKSAYPRTEGCGILLVKAGMEALQQGSETLAQQMIQAGVKVSRFEFRNLRGDLINAEDVEDKDNELPGVLIHRKAILETLLDHEGLADCIYGNATLLSVKQSDHSITAQFADGRQWEGDVLVGADGILSKTRQFVVPEAQLCYLGDLVWRGVVEDPAFCPAGGFLVYVRGRGIYANFFDIGPDPQQPSGPKRTHWGFFIEKDLTDIEQGKLRPQDTNIPEQELKKLPEDARDIITKTLPESIVTRYSYDLELLPTLLNQRLVLIGDAGHAKSPTRARGMTSGWEDALALAKHLVTGADVLSALVAFEAERLPIVHEYQRTSREMSQKIGRQHGKKAA